MRWPVAGLIDTSDMRETWVEVALVSIGVCTGSDAMGN
jgi:hypothetical protein